MRICRLYPVHSTNVHDFKWEWRSERCERRSSKKFDLFHDCMQDARRHGFEVMLQQAVGECAPARHALVGDHAVRRLRDQQRPSR